MTVRLSALVLILIALIASVSVAGVSSAWATGPQDPLHQTIPMPNKGGGTGTVSPDRGGTATTRPGDIAVTVPPGAVSADTTLYVAPQESEAVPSRGSSLVGHAFTVEAWQGLQPKSGFPFAKAVTIGIRYTEDDLAQVPGNDPQFLVIQYYDEASREWISLPTTIDRAAHKAYAQVERLAWFALGVATGQNRAMEASLTSSSSFSPRDPDNAGTQGSPPPTPAIVRGDTSLSEPRILLPLLLLALVLVAGGVYVLRRSRTSAKEPPADQKQH